MIQEFVDKWMAGKGSVADALSAEHPDGYADLVRHVVRVAGAGVMDHDRVHEVDEGDYQGTLLYVIGAKGCQQSDYWFVKVDYGSCSKSDTMEAICAGSSDPPNAEQVDDYMTLCLHIVQGLRAIGGASDE